MIAATGKAALRAVGLTSLALLLLTAAAGAEDPRSATLDAAMTEPFAAAVDGGPRRFELVASAGTQIRAAPDRRAGFVAPLDAGAIVANLGCEATPGGVWCAVQPIGGRLRGYVEAVKLRPARGPDGVVPMGPNDSPARAQRGAIDASGEIRCAMDRGQPWARCRAEIARAGGGDATVVATFPNGFKRRLYYVDRSFIRADVTMSGTGRDFDWLLVGGTHRVRVDDQRFELPDTLIFGRPDLQ
ncbi:MAG: hypothetical protein ACFBRM_09445 [Pikeienuella sp.]